MSRRSPLKYPNASRAPDGLLTVLQFNALKVACEDKDGEVFMASGTNMIEKGWVTKSSAGHRVFRVTPAGRKRYAEAVAKQQEAQRACESPETCKHPRNINGGCDRCGDPCY